MRVTARTIFLVLTIMTSAVVYGAEGGEKSVFDLGEIVVTGTRTPQALEDVPVQTRVITREELEMSGVQKAADLLRNLPGVQISGGAPGAVSTRSTVLLRGLPSQYSLVLVDGIRMKSEHIHTGVNLNLLPIDAIERIEIVEGPVSALYGSDAMGGVLNIITRKTGRPGGSVSVVGGNRQSYRENLAARFVLDKSENLVTYTHSETNGVDDKWYDRDNLMWKWELQHSERQQYNFTLDQYNGDSYKGDDSGFGALGEVTLCGKNGRVFKAGVSETQYSNYKPTNNDATGVHANYTVPLGEHLLTVGAEYRREDFERKSSPRHVVHTKGFYVQDEIYRAERFAAALALRAEDYSRLGVEYNPGAALKWDLSETTKLRFSAAKGFKAPSVQELYEVHYNHGTYVRDGNAALEPEESMSYSAGLERLISEKALLRFSIYRDNFDNMITVRNTGDYYSLTDDLDFNSAAACTGTCLPVRQRYNIKSAWSMGAITELRLRPSENTSMSFGYSYLKTRDDSTGEQLDYTPRNSFTFSVARRISSWNLSLRCEGVTGREYKDSASTYHEMDDYFVAGGNVSYSLRPSARLFLTVENLFDETYETFEEGKQPGQFARTWYFGVNREF